jgi:hypothetical protein
MKEQNKLKVFISKILLKLFGRKETPKEVSDENKREMCRRALQSGVCPHTCDICAWNTLR